MATNEELIWQYLKNQGLTDAGTAGLMGNLYAESGLRSINLQNTYEKKLGLTDEAYTKAVDNGSYTNFVRDNAGYGLAQWTYWSRKQNLINFAKEKNKSIGDLNMQLDFLMKELTTNYKTIVQILKTTTSVLEASNAILLHYEKPADQSISVQNKRARYGQMYYDKFAKTNIKPNNGDVKMKYNSNNKPLVCMQTNSTCYKSTRTMTPLGILWHSTGANNPYLKRYVQPLETDSNYKEILNLLGKNINGNDWNHITYQAGLNAWIGKTANDSITTIQTMPWNYRPWGCGSGSKGSCNNGWIQFEICEDGLNNKEYFEKTYKEACELTAYLCKMYNLNPLGTVKMNGINVPVILCHQDAYKLGLGSNHGDVYHWYNKYGKTMQDVRNDVAALMNGSIASQFTKEPTISSTSTNFKVGDEIKLIPGATYSNGKTIPNWLFDSKLYLREIKSNEEFVISTLSSGAITGVVKSSSVVAYNEKPVEPQFQSYLVKITADTLNVRDGAGTEFKVNTQVKKNSVYTIIDEKNGWGKLKSGAGWISLKYTQKVGR